MVGWFDRFFNSMALFWMTKFKKFWKFVMLKGHLWFLSRILAFLIKLGRIRNTEILNLSNKQGKKLPCRYGCKNMWLPLLQLAILRAFGNHCFFGEIAEFFFYYSVAFIYGRILQMLRYFRFRNASTFFGFEITRDKILWMLATEKARKQRVSIHLRLEINGDPSTWLSGIFDPKSDEFKT